MKTAQNPAFALGFFWLSAEGTRCCSDVAPARVAFDDRSGPASAQELRVINACDLPAFYGFRVESSSPRIAHGSAQGASRSFATRERSASVAVAFFDSPSGRGGYTLIDVAQAGKQEAKNKSTDASEAPTNELAKGLGLRKVALYEERRAARAYAYGVSDRRIHSWVQSTLGGRIGRSIDRSWPGFVRDLQQRWSTEQSPPLEHALAQELLDLCKILRCALPQVHVVQPGSELDLPVILPMASANGLDLRLWVNTDELGAMSSAIRSFWLGHALGHLQCGHGVYFATRMRMKFHGESSAWQWLLPLLRRAARLMVFSADRAGAGACASIEAAKSALLTPQAVAIQDWMGQATVPVAVRLKALEDFGKTANFERMVQLRAKLRPPKFPPGPTLISQAGPPAEDDPFRRLELGQSTRTEQESLSEKEARWSLSRCDQRLTQQLGMY